MLISSTRNPRIKALIELSKPSARRDSGLFLVEGRREIERAVHSGYELLQVFRDPALQAEPAWKAWQDAYAFKAEVLEVSSHVFARVAYRENREGLIAVFRQRTHQLAGLRLSDNPLVLVLEAIEKPGNLGAILRTADAAALDAVILCEPRIDLYNPNVIRSSLGCLFSVPIALVTSLEGIAWIQSHGMQIFTTYLQAAKAYHTLDYHGPTAIVMGTEDQGVSQAWVAAAKQNIIIPMQGIADSLNVSVSAAIMIYEAKRQRGWEGTDEKGERLPY